MSVTFQNQDVFGIWVLVDIPVCVSWLVVLVEIILTELTFRVGSSVGVWCSVSMVHPKSSMWLGFHLSLAAQEYHWVLPHSLLFSSYQWCELSLHDCFDLWLPVGCYLGVLWSDNCPDISPRKPLRCHFSLIPSHLPWTHVVSQVWNFDSSL